MIPFLQSSSGLNAGLSFELPATTSIVPVSSTGSGTATYAANSTRYVKDFEGLYKLVLANEARFQGARRVRNLVSDASGGQAKSEDISGWQQINTSGVTASQATYTATTGCILSNSSASQGGSLVYRISGEFSGTPSETINFALTDNATLAKGGGVLVTLTASYVRWSALVTAGTTVEIYSLTVGTRALGGLAAIGSGRTVNCRNLMYEVVTGQANQNPSEYVSVGVASAPYHGANVDGVKYFATENGNTVAANVVTEATGAAISTSTLVGYWPEGARADVLGATDAIRRTMTDVAWTVGATMTVGSATGVDGVASAAASLTGGAVTATNTILNTTVLASAARTYSAWVRRKTGTGTIEMTDNGGTNYTDITSLINSTTYTLVQITRTQANPVVGFRITTNLDAIEVDFNTIEEAAFANPTPIPVNVSKAEDALTFVFAGNASSTAGTMYAELSVGWTTSGGVHAAVGFGVTGGSAISVGGASASTTLRFSDGTNVTIASGLTDMSTGVRKRAASYAGVVALVTGDGVAATSGTFDGAMATTGIGIGVDADAVGNNWFGSVRNVRIYKRALSDQQLQALTA